MKTKGSFSLRVFLPLAFILASFAALGEASAKYQGKYWAAFDTKEILQVSQEITQAKYPDSDDATVEKKMLRIYHADGTAETQDETVTKILTEKGKRGD